VTVAEGREIEVGSTIGAERTAVAKGWKGVVAIGLVGEVTG